MIHSNLTDTGANGEWQGLEDWPLVALHAMVLPDGQVLTFGTNERGMQGGQFIYDLWNPVTGVHTTLPNSTNTDVFCSNIAIDPYLDYTLMVGGSVTIDGDRNQSIFDVTAFDYRSQTIFEAPDGDLNSARWYPGILTLGTGDIIAIGGREDRFAQRGFRGNDTFEKYQSGLGWDTLDGATMARMGDSKWYYPHVWLKSDGSVIMVEPNSNLSGAFIWKIDVEGQGSRTLIGNLGHDLHNRNSSINHRTDKALILDQTGNLLEVDFSGDAPVVSVIANIGNTRYDSDLMLLADGRVVITGGSTAVNKLYGAQQQLIIYDPETRTLEFAEEESLARLYHSTSTLTVEGAILSAGGGAPGPLTNLNAEIWVPDYLFDETGALADRPEVEARVDVLQPGQAFVVETDGSEIAKVTAVRSGSTTHGSHMDGRFLELEFTEIADGKIEVQTPANANIMVPGTWMIFAFDENGVPAVAEMLEVDPGVMTAPGSYQHGTSSYALGPSNLSFEEAQAVAAAMGGALVQIDDAWEAAFLETVFGNDDEFHFRDAAAAGPGDVLTIVEFDDARDLIAQTGSVTAEISGRSDWVRVEFVREMDDPVIVMGPPTINGTQEGIARVRRVDSSGFEFQFEEWEYLDGSHIAETIQWIAVERGVHVLDDGATIEAGVARVNHVGKDIAFSADFGTGGAVVIGQVGSHAGVQATTHRLFDVDDAGFSAKLDEEEANGWHLTEDLHWIAFEAGNHNAFSAFTDADAIESASDGTGDYAIDTRRPSNSDAFFADLQSRNSDDTASLRLVSDPGEAPVLMLEEEQSLDPEVDHVLEDVAWVMTDEFMFV